MLKLAIKDTHIIPQIRIEKKQKIAKANKLLKKIIDFIQYVIKKSTKKMYQKTKKFNHFFIKKSALLLKKNTL